MTVSELSTDCPTGHPGGIYYLSRRDSPPMRKIERLMNAAITREVDWKCDNTEVRNEDGLSKVFLHGNLIAEIGDTFLRLFDGGWQSNTTKSRLNAILREHGAGGECVFQKQWQWFITMNTDRGMETVPFRSSMKLG